MVTATKRHWSKLPPVRGFTRVPDRADGSRQLQCNICKKVIPSLGVGYHKQGGAGCRERALRNGSM